jgi:hypothetical protein
MRSRLTGDLTLIVGVVDGDGHDEGAKTTRTKMT